jgi:hypothetical protein
LLKIKIIPIGRDHSSLPLKVYPTEEFDNWTHYLFLYFQDAHYELITFNFKQPDETNEKITIFKRETILDAKNFSMFGSKVDKKPNFYILIPPLYILFTIFGSSYYSQTEEVQDKFKLFPNIMTLFGTSMNNILTKYTTSSEEAKKMTCNFIADYKNLFPLTTFKSFNFDDCNAIKGGQNIYNIHNYYDNNRNVNILNNDKERKQRYLNKNEPLKSFYITYISIDLELHPGTTITPEEKQNLNCKSKWNAIRKAYSEFTGKPYVIKPIYKNIEQKNYTKKNVVANLNRYTKKHKQKSKQKQKQYTKKRYK